MAEKNSFGPSCLLIIDVQRGFVNEHTAHIPARVEQLQKGYDYVVATRFFNPPNSFYRTLIRWERFSLGSADIDLAFDLRPDATIIDKSRYSAVGPILLDQLAAWNVRRPTICGIDTDICVSKTAIDLFEAAIIPVVLVDYCASTGGPDVHAAALPILRRAIGDTQVI